MKTTKAESGLKTSSSDVKANVLPSTPQLPSGNWQDYFVSCVFLQTRTGLKIFFQNKITISK
jgi:DNA/RNA endonuclease G (NUC1)